MNTKFIGRLGCVALALCASTAFSQPALQCGTANIAPGASGSVSCDYLGTGSTVVGGQVTLTIASADVTVDSYTCANGFTCPASGSPANIIFADFGLQEFQDTANAIQVNVTVAGGAMAPQDVPVAISGEQYADAANAPVAASGSQDGNIRIQDGPGPGILNVQPAALGLGADVNAPAGTGVITISNDGAMGDATINPTCSLSALSGGAAATTSINVTAAPASLAPGASGTVTASCSGTAVGQATADYTCSAGAAVVTNATTAITCDIAVGTPNPNPAAGTTTSINVGPVTRGNSGVGALTFTETNNSGGSYDVSCVLTDDGMGAFAITSAATATVNAATPFTFAVSGTSTVTDPQPTGLATCTYSGDATGTVTINLGIALVPEIVPTMTEWGLILLTLALVGFGAFQLRRRAPLA